MTTVITREPIYAALFAAVSGAASFVTISRRLKHWSDCSPAEQPALYMTQRKENVQRKPGLNPVWRLEVDLYIYVHTRGDSSVSPGSLLNPLLDAVSNVLAPDNLMTNKFTLGGLVQHAWIEGTIETDEGILGDQGVAIIPICIEFA
jgi:hypothetical protein